MAAKKTRSPRIKVTTGDKEYFKNIGKIPYEGKESDNPLAFKWYNEKQKVADKTMNTSVLR